MLDLAFLSTAKQVRQGFLKKCIDNFFSKKTINPSNIRVYIFTDEKVNKNHLTKILNNHGVTKVFIENVNIHKKDNIYIKDQKETDCAFGLSSGPNILFFKACEKLFSLSGSHFFIIEPDVFPVKDFWFERLYLYCLFNDFLIAGSTYKGVCKHNNKDLHINGVAIYRNSKSCRDVIYNSKNFILEKIKEKKTLAKSIGERHKWMLSSGKPEIIQNWFKTQSKIKIRKNIRLNYDVGIYEYCKKYRPELLLSKKIRDTKIITNACKNGDSKVTARDILKFHKKTVILHKK